MSRSRKKHPVSKDGTKRKRTLHHRRFRRINKSRICSGEEPLLQKEITNPWDIIDWIFTWWKIYPFISEEEWNQEREKVLRK